MALCKSNPNNPGDGQHELKFHAADPRFKEYGDVNDQEIPDGHLLKMARAEMQPLLNICVTMYNEPYSQLVESLIGIYRNYFELVEWKKEFKNRVHVYIIADGYDRLSFDFLEKLERAGMYNSFGTANYKKVELKSDNEGYDVKLIGN